MQHGFGSGHIWRILNPTRLGPDRNALGVVIELGGSRLCVADTFIPLLRQGGNRLRPMHVEENIGARINELRRQNRATLAVEDNRRSPFELCLFHHQGDIRLEVEKDFRDISSHDHVGIQKQRLSPIPTQPRHQEPRVSEVRQSPSLDRQLRENERGYCNRPAGVSRNGVLQDVVGNRLSGVVADEDAKWARTFGTVASMVLIHDPWYSINVAG